MLLLFSYRLIVSYHGKEALFMKISTSTVIEEYYEKVFKINMLCMTGGCFAASVCFAMLKLLGHYPGVSWVALIIFLIIDAIYMIIGITFTRIGYENGKLRPKILKYGKIYFVFIIIVQWNYISYMVPTRDFWGYAFFFLFFALLYFDIKLVGISTAGLAISIAISYLIKGDALLPVRDELFFPDMFLRILCLVLSMSSILLLTFLSSRYLHHKMKVPQQKSCPQ